MEKETDLTTYRRRLNDLRNNVCLGHREANTEPVLFTLLEQLGINTNEPLTFIRQYRGNTSSKKHVDFCIVLNNGNKILIELKPFSEKLYKTLEYRFSQIEEYISIMKDINVIILTNGALFYFYRRETVRDTFELNPFLTIDMDDMKNEQLYLRCLKLLFYQNFSNDSINAVISVKGTPQINRLKEQLLNGQIQKDDYYIDDAEEDTSNNTFFGKAIDFKSDCFRIDILPNKVQDILFFGNLINMFGPFNTEDKTSDNMKANIKYIKNIIKKNPNATLHIWGNRKMRKYFKKCFINLEIDIKKNVSFDSINSIEELNDKIENMKFDVAILNPPYKDKLYIDILSVISKKTDRMLFVSPLSWILNKPSQNKIFDLAKKYKCIIKYFDAFKYFGRNGHRCSGITFIDKTLECKGVHLNDVYYDNIESLVYVNGIKELNEFYNIIVPQVKDSIDNHIYYSQFVENSRYKKNRNCQDKNIPCVVIPLSIGDSYSLESNQSKCIIRPSDVKNNTIIKMYNDLNNDDKFYIPCHNMKYAENVVKYLMTDFARVCFFFRISVSLLIVSDRHTTLIPWQDFEDNVLFSGTIDEINNRLFKKYGITLTEEQKAFIEEKFPKVYDL